MSDPISSKLSAMIIILFELCGVEATSHMCLVSPWKMPGMTAELTLIFFNVKLKWTHGTIVS